MIMELIKVWVVIWRWELGVEGPEVEPLGLHSPYTASQTHLRNPRSQNNTVY